MDPIAWSKRSIILSRLGLALAIALPALMFQNCSNVEPLDSSQTSSNSRSPTNTGTLYSDVSSASYVSPSSGVATSSPSGAASSTNMVLLTASNSAKMDCSSDDATLTTEVLNSESNVLVCLEHILDMPVGSPRYGEKSLCDVASKFANPPSSWIYNGVGRKWMIPVERLKNNSILVPGSYRLFIKDRLGNITSSQAAVVKKTNAVNCFAGSGAGGGSTGACAWTQLSIGGGQMPRPPTATCNVQTAWSTAIDGNGIQQTCVCPGVPAPPGPNPNGYLTAAVNSPRNVSYYEFLTGNGSSQPNPTNQRGCSVGTVYSGYNSCGDTWYNAGTNEAYKICNGWSQSCTDTMN